jgi:hypothetical protein
LQLDQTQEQRPLDDDELHVCRVAKEKILALTVVRKIRLRQRSRPTWIRAGEANTKLFHLRANGWGWKNYLPSLQLRGRTITAQEDKAEALKAFCTDQFRTPQPRECTLNWATLQTPRHELAELDRDITKQEIKAAVMQTPSEKAPGPDGYMRAFCKLCWDMIKEDVVGAIQDIFSLRANYWNLLNSNLLNSANIELIMKKEGAQLIGDYRPISIMHIMAKLLGKILANRLAPQLDQLVWHGQSAFIKGQSIHDNFQYVQGAIKHLHHSKMPMLFIKLDIAKAFDSVQWEYMLEVMGHLSFG